MRGQALPLAELSWQGFERLILRLVRREGEIVECSVYGTPGQVQGGIDILATHLEQVALRVCYPQSPLSRSALPFTELHFLGVTALAPWCSTCFRMASLS